MTHLADRLFLLLGLVVVAAAPRAQGADVVWVQHQRAAATLFGDDRAAFNRLVRDRNVPAVVIK